MSVQPLPLRFRIGLRRRSGTLGSAWRQPLAIVGMVLAGAWILVAIFVPLIAPYDPLAQTSLLTHAPSPAHLFGTDELGRDVLSRVLWGSRLSLPIAFLLVVAAVVVGAALGGLAGYFGGWVDEAVMRATDLFFAFPTIILAMAVTAALGPSLPHAVLAVLIVFWPSYARVVRGLVMSLKQSDYVSATRLLGASSLRALVVDVLPNVAGPVLVLATLDLGNAVLLLAGLSFLGLGAQPGPAEWGSMVNTGSQYFEFWWMGTFPGFAILSVVLAFNFLGDSLRDGLDPRSSWSVQRAVRPGAGGGR
jgi:ABC-type dipeptide/oligopeptide/nickel transport system permease subunit